MREVSQNWLNNQNKTLRDQGLLRLDFLSAHNNNAYAHIIPMGSDANKSNINEIKEIYPYGAPTKNLAMPDLTGKPEISVGVYRLYNGGGITIDYNIFNDEYEINGTSVNSGMIYLTALPIIEPLQNVSRSIYYVSGTVNINNALSWHMVMTDTSKNDMAIDPSNSKMENTITETEIVGLRLRFYLRNGREFNNYKFKLQLEQGDTATPYEIPQPNTGYVSTAITNPDGTLTPAGSDYYTLDQPIAELNNHTLREVFEQGNLVVNGDFNSVSDWTPVRSTYTVNNNVAKVVGNVTGSNMGIVQIVDSVVGNEYYYYAEMMTPDVVSNIRLYFDNTLTSVSQSNPEPNRFYKMGAIRTITAYARLEPNLAFTDTNGKTLNVKNVLVIDRTSLGISSLSQEQMDYWFNVYQTVRVVPIEVNVENYRSPLNGLTITWSENFGHAVDYSIEYNGEIYTYLNNTKKTVFVPIIVENTPDANFKIRVHKWSQGNVPIRIERVFVGLHIVNYQDRIFSYSKKRVNDVLSLELPQDEINFELSNIDRMFDPLWYNSYFKYLNEKTEIRVYSGFRLDGKNAEWIKNGTFYLTDWKAPNNSITASFTARDILNLLDADEMYSKSGALTLDDYCDIILGRDYKGVDNFENYNLPVNPDGSKKWNIRKNLAVPDLTGKPDLGGGWYQIQLGANYDRRYNVFTGEWYMDGVFPSLFAGSEMITFEIDILEPYVLKPVLISGTHNSTRDFIFRTTEQGYRNINSGEIMNIDNSSTLQWRSNIDGLIYNNAIIKFQLEKGAEATDYELPIENAIVPVSMETRTKREVLQLLAQSVNAHIHLDDDANISFIRDVTGQQLNADKKIMFTKPEFNIAAPVKKIIVPISTYTSDPNELELARIQVTAGETIEINHDLPYSGGRVEVSGSLTVASQDNTWYRSYKILVGGSGSGELVLYRHQMARTTMNLLQDVGSSGTSMTYENPMIDTKLKASRALTKIWSEISNSRQVEFDLRIDPLFNTLDAVSFPFKVLNLEQTEFMRIDELEINYNGAYKGKIKGVILSNYGGDLTDKTYIKHTKEFNSGEENLKWHLSNK